MPTPGFQPIPKPSRPRRRSNAERRADDAELAIPKDCIRVVDADVLSWARTLSVCEWCGAVGATEPSHTKSRGAGGGDTFENVCGLGKAATCPCHGNHHLGHEPTHEQLLATADRRERVYGRGYAVTLAMRYPAAWQLSADPAVRRPPRRRS